MRSNPFYFEIKDVMTQFVAAFNDIVIKRHDRSKQERSRVKVRYMYAPKQRVIHDLTNKARHITLPVVAVNISSVSRDESRVFNKLYGSYVHDHDNSRIADHVPQPVPINIDVNMSILARYQTDIEQIISNFVPYNDPYIVISWKTPQPFFDKQHEIRSEVLWSGNLSMDYPDNLSSNEPYRLSCDTNFTIKAWLFKKAPSKETSTIYKITSNMQISDILEFDEDSDLVETSGVESIGPTLTAAPHITHVTTGDTTCDVLGYNFNTTTNVMLSSTQLNELSGQVIEMHPDRQISTYYPAITATPVDYHVVNDNRITINLPETTAHQADIVIVNPGGYGTSLQSKHHGQLITLKDIARDVL